MTTEKFINGSYKILSLEKDGFFFPIACITSSSFNESVEILGTTVRTNEDGWSTALPTMQSYSISFDGLVRFEPYLANAITFSDITEFKRSRTLINWQINSPNGEADTGHCYITDINNTFNEGELVSFNGTLQGFGKASRLFDVVVKDYTDRVLALGGYLGPTECLTNYVKMLIGNNIYNRFSLGFGFGFGAVLDKVANLKPTADTFAGVSDFNFSRAITEVRTNVITNGDFDNGSTDWVLLGHANVLSSALNLTTFGDGAYQDITTLVDGAVYNLRGVIYGNTGNEAVSVEISLGNNTPQLILNATGFFGVDLVAGTDNNRLTITARVGNVLANVDSLIMFKASQASGATFLDIDGFIKNAIEGTPRRDFFNNTTCGQLLIEPASENLLSKSDQFDNVYWAKTRVSEVLNVAVNLYFERPAYNSIATVTNEFGATVSKIMSLPAEAKTYTLSLFYKYKQNDYCVLYFRGDASNTTRAWLNLATGQIGTIENTGTELTNVVWSVEAYPNGWYRLIVTFDKSSLIIAPIIYIYAATDGDGLISCTAGQQNYISCAQLEQNPGVTSYIDTDTTPVTRAVETLGSESRQSAFVMAEGVIFLELDINKFNYDMFLKIFANRSSSLLKILFTPDGFLQINANVNNTNVLIYDSLKLNIKKIAVRWKADDWGLFVDGVKLSLLTSLPTGFKYNIAQTQLDSSVDSQWNARISRYEIYSGYLSDTELIKLTT